MAGLAWTLFVAGSLRVATGTPPPEPVVNGTDALACEFPAAASALRFDGSHACTVIVLHPRVVMLAAHCLYSGDLEQIVFGENAFTPAAAVPIENCDIHPGFTEVDDMNYLDLAYCTLGADAPAVPIVPPLMGCEADELVAGATVVLPGYGLNDEPNYTGQGIKRWTTNTVESVDVVNNDLYLVGTDGSSVCFGDSGGPAYLQLSDGTWRVVGVTSESHPAVDGMQYLCGYGAVYDLVHLEMEWFETTTGYDVTPCFDSDGTWHADETCGSFPTSLTTAGLDWTSACATDELSEWSATCGDPFMSAGTSTGTGSESSSDTGDDSTSEGGTEAASTSNAVDDSTSSSSTTDEPTTAPFGVDSSESSGGPAQTGDEGCGCRSATGAPPLLLVLLVSARARRRRRAAARGSCT